MKQFYFYTSIFLKFLIFCLGIYTYLYLFAPDGIGILLSLCLAIGIQWFLIHIKSPQAQEMDLFITIVGGLDMLGFAFLFHNEVTPWYDDVMHYIVPLALGLFLFHVVFQVQYFGKISLSKKVIGTITFMAICTMALVWEIFEFLIDQYYHGEIVMQAGVLTTPLEDSMHDLTWGMCAATSVSIFGSFFLSSKQ